MKSIQLQKENQKLQGTIRRLDSDMSLMESTLRGILGTGIGIRRTSLEVRRAVGREKSSKNFSFSVSETKRLRDGRSKALWIEHFHRRSPVSFSAGRRRRRGRLLRLQRPECKVFPRWRRLRKPWDVTFLCEVVWRGRIIGVEEFWANREEGVLCSTEEQLAQFIKLM